MELTHFGSEASIYYFIIEKNLRLRLMIKIDFMNFSLAEVA